MERLYLDTTEHGKEPYGIYPELIFGHIRLGELERARELQHRFRPPAGNFYLNEAKRRGGEYLRD
jgi:hypothetical protein